MDQHQNRNPLLEMEFAIPFDQIHAAHVEPAVRQLLAGARAAIGALAASTGPRTYANTMQVLDRATENLEYAMQTARHLESVATTPELRAAVNAVQPEVSAFYSGIPLNPGLYRVLREFAATGEAQSLDPVRRRFLDKTLENFRRHGAELDQDGKKRLEEIDVELSRITTKFAENVLDATNRYELLIDDERRLAGLPASALDAARESAASKGLDGWRFTLQGPSYLAAMTYLDDASIRQTLYHEYSTRATSGEFDNRALIGKILALRKEKARLLGFENFADLVLEDRMAHTGREAFEFLRGLKQKTERHFHTENEELHRFRQTLEGASAAPPAAWDIAYYAEKQRAALYDFDEESLRPYFPLDRVVSGMFEIARRLYGITVSHRPGVPAWDPAVRYYHIHNEAGMLLGGFYADWYPRENKRGGAWMDALLTGGPDGAGFLPHAGVICGNLTPPTAARPALLTHREVETVFHEFGHLLHHCLSNVEVHSLAGTNVAWDFVELPSQIMENWCWERPALDLFAAHWETGEPLPEELFLKMKRARTFRAANAQMRQLGFGFIDLALHIEYSAAGDGDAISYSRRLLEQFSPAPLPADHAMIAGFTHLFASPVAYGAGYYSYKWAEVLDADAFTRFRQTGIFSREVGSAFRESILSKGNSADPASLYRKFMGRDPNPDALLERQGLLSA
ncbi:MAG: M3 family metallopeptidase [Bryobacterales bacterium]|nr:M3 family metallopeptidase [Bryobacterales bacterium]